MYAIIPTPLGSARLPTPLVKTLLIPLAAFVFFVPQVSARQASDPLDDLFARSRANLSGLKTVTASFTERTVSSLLREPIVATGTLVAAMPLRVAMTYATPTPKTVAFDRARLVVDWPSVKIHENIEIAETQRRVQQYFTDFSAKQLRETFTITLVTEGKTYRLDMLPRRKQVAAELVRLRLWVDGARLELVKMTMDYPGGDSKTLELSAIRMNVPIDDAAFLLLAPPGTPRR
jgi:outer membrane lipoprotein-sorting protein